MCSVKFIMLSRVGCVSALIAQGPTCDSPSKSYLLQSSAHPSSFPHIHTTRHIYAIYCLGLPDGQTHLAADMSVCEVTGVLRYSACGLCALNEFLLRVSCLTPSGYPSSHRLRCMRHMYHSRCGAAGSLPPSFSPKTKARGCLYDGRVNAAALVRALRGLRRAPARL